MQRFILPLRVAGTIFALVALGQLCRVLYQFDISIAGWHVPLFASGVAVVFAGGLSWWMWQTSVRANATNRPG
jgi:hypothetical protein